MKTVNESALSNIFWWSLATSVLLALIEALLMCVIKIAAQMVFFGKHSGITGVDPFTSIVQGSVFVLIMRALLGFIALNFALWTFMALKKMKVSLFLICLANAASVLLMYCVWDWKYDIFHDLFFVKRFSDLFGWVQCGLLCSLLSPVILVRITLVPNVLPLITRS